ncbi:site-specific DNA-methyltransferase [Psychrobacter sp. H8-1]|uniref:site-specific DNA-methyltransferase n=1 Tax=Psychrobacter sp. H8-1 TaxID=2774129 RepID=UPI0019195336|nr:site-specific DNA-methyltransferase [Psychrobacter sp. H8-1]
MIRDIKTIEDVNWAGGSGFKFYRLGEVIFNENGSLREGISFDALASHIWYGDTRQSLQQSAKSPLLGVHNGVAYYLLYNGILGDKRPNGGNVLTSKVLSILPLHPEDPENGKKVIYGETSRMGEARLKSENIIFKQIPYDVKGR